MAKCTKKQINKLIKCLYFYIIGVTVVLLSAVSSLIMQMNLDLSDEGRRQLAEQFQHTPLFYRVWTTPRSRLYDGSFGEANWMSWNPLSKTERVLFQPINQQNIRGALMIAHDCLNSPDFSELIKSSDSINIVQNGYYVYFVKVKRTKPRYIRQRSKVFSEELRDLWEFANELKKGPIFGNKKLYFYGDGIWCYHGLTIATLKDIQINNNAMPSDLFGGFICNNGYSSIKRILSVKEFDALEGPIKTNPGRSDFPCSTNKFDSGTMQHYFYYLWCNCLFPNQFAGCVEPWYNRRNVGKPILRIHDILNENVPITESANMVKGIEQPKLLTKYNMYYYSDPPNVNKIGKTILNFMKRETQENINQDQINKQLYFENIATFKYRSLIPTPDKMYPNCHYLYHIITQHSNVNMAVLKCRAIYFYSLIKEEIDDKYGENNMNHYSEYLLPFLDKPKYNNDKIGILNKVYDTGKCNDAKNMNSFETIHKYAIDSIYLLEKHEKLAKSKMNGNDLKSNEYTILF